MGNCRIFFDMEIAENFWPRIRSERVVGPCTRWIGWDSSYNFMSMVKSYDGSCENSCNGSQMQVRRSESRSTPILVMHFKTKVHEKQAEKEPFVEPYRTRSF